MSRVSRFLSLSIIAGAVLYVAIEIALHVLRTDYNPARRFLSEYAVGRCGTLGTVAFCLLAGMSGAFTLALALEVRRSWPLIVTCLLLSLVCLGFCALAMFPTDLMDSNGRPPSVRTNTGIVHDASTAVLSAALGVAALILPCAYGRDPRWSVNASKIFLFGIFIPLFLCIASALPWQWRGVGQRLLVASGLIWMIANSRLLSRSIQFEPGKSNGS